MNKRNTPLTSEWVLALGATQQSGNVDDHRRRRLDVVLLQFGIYTPHFYKLSEYMQIRYQQGIFWLFLIVSWDCDWGLLLQHHLRYLIMFEHKHETQNSEEKAVFSTARILSIAHRFVLHSQFLKHFILLLLLHKLQLEKGRITRSTDH